MPVAIAILLSLFAGQRYGTAKVGMLFGPAMLSWFVVIGLLGAVQVFQNPKVLKALNPLFATQFLKTEGGQSLFVLGAVFLVITGGEALYADMEHFGKKAIRRTWFYLVLPALLLNYFGQGALLLRDPSLAANPFFNLASEDWLLLLVGLSTIATIIALYRAHFPLPTRQRNWAICRD